MLALDNGHPDRPAQGCVHRNRHADRRAGVSAAVAASTRSWSFSSASSASVTGRRACSRSPSCRRRRPGCARWRSPRPRQSRYSESSRSMGRSATSSMVWTPPPREIDASAEVWATPGGESGLLTTIPFRATALASLARVPGVSSVGLYRGSFLNWGDRRLWILGPPANTGQPIPPTQMVSGNLALATDRVRDGGWAVISQALASEHHLHVGQAFTLPAPRPIRLRVAALSTNLGWPPGAIILSSSDYARAWGSGDPSAYEIQTAPGVSAVAVRSGVQRALGPRTDSRLKPSLNASSVITLLSAQGLSRLTQIRLLVLIAAVLAVAGAMGSMIWQRRDLVAFIKRQGYRRSVLWRWLLCESALLLAAGCLIGAVFRALRSGVAQSCAGGCNGLSRSFQRWGSDRAAQLCIGQCRRLDDRFVGVTARPAGPAGLGQPGAVRQPWFPALGECCSGAGLCFLAVEM